jgi:hypothetical protein
VQALAEVYALMVYRHEDTVEEACLPLEALDAWLGWYDTTPDTPCIAICSTSQGDDLCKGCGRTFDEVQHWPAMGPAEKAPGVAPHHAVGHRLGAIEYALQIDVNHLVKLLGGHFLQARVLRDAGVVDQHVNAAELGLDLSHHIVHHRALGDIHDKTFSRGTQRATLSNRLIDAGLLDVADDHDSSLGRKLERCGQTNTLRCAGNDGNLVGKTCCHDSILG